jgi:uncharacterized membrane-anchored protein
LRVNSDLGGVRYLLDNNIRIYEVQDSGFFDFVKDGDSIAIDSNNNLFVNNIPYTVCSLVDMSHVLKACAGKEINDIKIKYNFVKNTMMYMDDELDYFLYGKKLPPVETDIKGREVIIISRGRHYREDLKAVKSYILSRKPVIISVDGGANAVSDLGIKSDIIIGDMDSVSDKSLLSCREILVHTYSNGYAPGLSRIKALKLRYKLLALKGTSEDAAIYTAKLKGASMIYLIGGHNCVEEFLEKGRPGMGTTALLRILLGDKIVDLKGIGSIMKYNKPGMNYAPAAVIALFFICYILLTFNDAVDIIQTHLRFLFK